MRFDMKKVTLKNLQKINACQEGIDIFESEYPKSIDIIPCIKRLIKEDRTDWANWLIVRYMTYKQYVSYAVYSARLVLHLIKDPDKYKLALNCIKSAERCITNPSKKNKQLAKFDSASASASYSYSASYSASAYASAYASDSASNSAYDSASASASVSASYSASNSAYASASNSAYSSAYDSASAKQLKKILRKGIKLLQEENET